MKEATGIAKMLGPLLWPSHPLIDFLGAAHRNKALRTETVFIQISNTIRNKLVQLKTSLVNNITQKYIKNNSQSTLRSLLPKRYNQI